jgi:hypothetical protein
MAIRGDGKNYKFNFACADRTDGTLFQSRFATVAGIRATILLPLADFLPTFRGRVLQNHPPLDPRQIVSCGFMISEKQSGEFGLEIATIEAVCTSSPASLPGE